MADDESQNDEAQLTEEDSSYDTITVRSLNDDKSLRCEVRRVSTAGSEPAGDGPVQGCVPVTSSGA